jgi:hypothetical protein
MSYSCEVLNKKDISIIINNLGISLKKNNVANLRREEKLIVKDVSDKLKKIFDDVNITFDEKGFEDLIRVLYQKHVILGGNSTSLLTRSNPLSVSKYDLYTLLAFVTSILLLYLSYIQLNSMLESTFNTNTNEMTEQLKIDFENAVSNLETEKKSLLIYMFTVFKNFGCNVTDSAMRKTVNIIQNIIGRTSPQMLNQISDNCGIKTTNTLFKILSTATNFIVGSTTTIDCSTGTLDLIAQQKALEVRLLLLNLNVQGKQINSLISVGLTLGYSSISYFTYRIYQLRSYNNSRRIEQPEQNLINQGGKKSKKHKKTKNSKTKKRKH